MNLEIDHLFQIVESEEDAFSDFAQLILVRFAVKTKR